MELSMSETDPSSHTPDESSPDTAVMEFVSIIEFLGGKGWRADSLPAFPAMMSLESIPLLSEAMPFGSWRGF